MSARTRPLSLVLVGLALALPAAAHDIVAVPLASVLEMPEAKGKLDGTVAFHLAGVPAPHVVKTFWEATVTEKTNAFNKASDVGCRWVALSALMELQRQAKRAGANAVVDIVSFHRKQRSSSPTDIECHDGVFSAGVALKGTLVVVEP